MSTVSTAATTKGTASVTRLSQIKPIRFNSTGSPSMSVMAMLTGSISKFLEANEKPQHASDPREQKYPAKFLAGYQIVGKIAENWGSVPTPSEA
jgi:hypothetical protein